MRRNRLIWILTTFLLVLLTAPAYADGTLFLGASTTPDNRALRGGAIGMGLLVVSFEFEYASTVEDAATAAPAVKTGSGNVLLQTPTMIHGLQPYVTVGGGLYRERLGTLTTTGAATNTGGGLKIALAGPLRLRLDYRVFKVEGGALYSPAHRVYIGLNVRF